MSVNFMQIDADLSFCLIQFNSIFSKKDRYLKCQDSSGLVANDSRELLALRKIFFFFHNRKNCFSSATWLRTD